MRALVVFVILVGTGAARADVISPEVAACNNKQAGDACDGGVCAAATCSHVLPPGPDGKPVANEYACMKCVAGTPTNPAAAAGSPSRTPLVVGLGLGALVLAGGVWFARKRGKQAA